MSIKNHLKKRFPLTLSILLSLSLFLVSVSSIQMITAQTETQFLFGVPSPEIVINKTEFSPGEKVEITIQKMPEFPPNTDPRLELYVYLPFLQKIGGNVPLNCLGEHCLVVYSFDEIRQGETSPKTISFVLFSEKNSKPIVESGWMNSVCDLKFNGKTVERYGNTCNSLDLPYGIYDIKFGWGIEISDKFEIIKTIPITVKEYSVNIESKNQTLEKSMDNILDRDSDTKELIDNNADVEKTVVERESELVQDLDKTITDEGGGCLIATASYESELSPQVQFLREIRDNTVMSTSSGVAFITGFNQIYYSFSPTISDWERENPVFKEAVKVFITPMLSTLSIMTLAEDGSEAQVLGLGISVIVLNFGMYFAAPIGAVFTVRKYFK